MSNPHPRSTDSHCLTCQDLPSHILCIHEGSSSTIASQTASPIHLHLNTQTESMLHTPKVFFKFAFDFLYLLFGILAWIEGTTRCYKLVDVVFWQYMKCTTTQKSKVFSHKVVHLTKHSVVPCVDFRTLRCRGNMQAVFGFTKCAWYMILHNNYIQHWDR